MKHWNFNGEPWCHTHSTISCKYELTKSAKEVDCKSCLKLMKAFKRRCKQTEKEIRRIWKNGRRDLRLAG